MAASNFGNNGDLITKSSNRTNPYETEESPPAPAAVPEQDKTSETLSKSKDVAGEPSAAGGGGGNLVNYSRTQGAQPTAADSSVKDSGISGSSERSVSQSPIDPDPSGNETAPSGPTRSRSRHHPAASPLSRES